MQLIKSIIFTIVFVFIWSGTFAIIMLPVGLFKPVIIWTSITWGRVALWGLRFLCGIDYEVRGIEHRSETPVIYAMKHQSAWDTFAINVIFYNTAIVLKKELTFIPVIGLYFLAGGCIPVKRSDGRKALIHMIELARRRVQEEDRSIFIFPEGHRMDIGTEPNYHPGIAALYKDLNIPVVPIALNSGFFWKRRGLYKKPGTIVIELLPPIEPGLDRKEFMKVLVDRIETKTNELINEARSIL